MSQNLFDPHIDKGRGTHAAIVAVLVVVPNGLRAAFVNNPGAGGSLSEPNACADRW